MAAAVLEVLAEDLAEAAVLGADGKFFKVGYFNQQKVVIMKKWMEYVMWVLLAIAGILLIIGIIRMFF